MVHRSQSVAVAEAEDEQGAVIVLLAFLLFTLLVMVALVIDLANARQTRRQAQNAADAAALSAAVVLARPGPPNFAQAVADAKRYVFSNYGDVGPWSGCADTSALGYKPDPGNDCISFNSTTAPNLVRVRIPTRSVPTLFGGVAGLKEINVDASAIAQIPSATDAPCGLCVLSAHGDQALALLRGGGLYVTGNGVVVNSDRPQAVETDNGSFLDADPVWVVGGYSNADIRPGAQTIASPIPDPLGGLIAPPPWSGVQRDIDVDDSDVTLPPGNYDDINVNGTGTLTLDPGAGPYVITGTVTIRSGGHIVGNGVTLYLTCGVSSPTPCDSSGEDGGTFDIQDGGTVSLSAPTSGTYKGLAVFYDRNNTAGLKITHDFGVTGTIYVASGPVELGGPADFALSSMVVAETVFTGEHNVVLNYDASENVEVRRIPTLFQ
jgi:Flp pilus assembly protein TadG